MCKNLKMSDEKILGEGDKKRDQNTVKVCSVCNTKYHPRRVAYQALSQFCSTKCSGKGSGFNAYANAYFQKQGLG